VFGQKPEHLYCYIIYAEINRIKSGREHGVIDASGQVILRGVATNQEDLDEAYPVHVLGAPQLGVLPVLQEGLVGACGLPSWILRMPADQELACSGTERVRNPAAGRGGGCSLFRRRLANPRKTRAIPNRTASLFCVLTYASRRSGDLETGCSQTCSGECANRRVPCRKKTVTVLALAFLAQVVLYASTSEAQSSSEHASYPVMAPLNQ